jgi:hypothetical protein
MSVQLSDEERQRRNTKVGEDAFGHSVNCYGLPLGHGPKPSPADLKPRAGESIAEARQRVESQNNRH